MATPVVPNQFAVGKNQIIHKDAADDFFMQGLMVAPNTGGRCAGVREPFPKATESQTIS
jgi:hypothetical protein